MDILHYFDQHETDTILYSMFHKNIKNLHTTGYFGLVKGHVLLYSPALVLSESIQHQLPYPDLHGRIKIILKTLYFKYKILDRMIFIEVY